MYQPSTSANWQSLPAILLGALLVLALFAVLPFVNRIDARRTRSSGDLSIVSIAPLRPVTVASAQPRAPAPAPVGAMPIAAALSRQAPGMGNAATVPVHMPQLAAYEPGVKKLRAFVDESELDAPPLPFHRTRPEYPYALRRDGIAGKVLVEFRVDAEGRVFDVHVLETSHPDFGESVARAVLHWRFVPGTVRGETVSFKMRLPVRFTIENTPREEPEEDATLIGVPRSIGAE